MTEKYSNLNTKYQKTTNLLFYCFSAFTFIAIIWSFIFQIDIVSNAEGQVIPVGEVKTIQHLEGGIIEKILVKESEYVETGQPLVILAATASEVDVEELQVRMDTQIIKSISVIEDSENSLVKATQNLSNAKKYLKDGRGSLFNRAKEMKSLGANNKKDLN